MNTYNVFLLESDTIIEHDLIRWFSLYKNEQDIEFEVYSPKDNDIRKVFGKDSTILNQFNLIILNASINSTIGRPIWKTTILQKALKWKNDALDTRILIDSSVVDMLSNKEMEEIEILRNDVFDQLEDETQLLHVRNSIAALYQWQITNNESISNYSTALSKTYSTTAEYGEYLLNDGMDQTTVTETLNSQGDSRMSAILNMSAGLPSIDESSTANGAVYFEEEYPNLDPTEAPELFEEVNQDITEVLPNQDLIEEGKSPACTKEVPKSPENDEEKNNLVKNARQIQRELFAQHNWEENKTIGVWSPISKAGVTTFIINYATFLAENRLYVGVLEALRHVPTLKSRLQSYSSMPKDWVSYAKTIHNNDYDISAVRWSYRNVLYLPLDRYDSSLDWNAEKLGVYLDLPTLMDLTLVDMPTGEMELSTIKTLDYLTELWILVDDNHSDILSWYNYIHQLKETHKLEVKLIFNKAFSFSLYEELSNALDLPLISVIPALHEDMARNNYQNGPVISIEEVRMKLFDSFAGITKHLMGADYVLHSQKSTKEIVPSMQQQSPLSQKYWNVFFNGLKSLLKNMRAT